MYINFEQGIISYPYSGSLQQFLVRSGIFMNLSRRNGPTFINFTYKTANYQFIENVTIPAAWGPLINGDQWLYWDLNTTTAVRTFGITLLQPAYGPTAPSMPQPDQHWYNTTQKVMYVWQTGGWRPVIRVFAAKVTATQIIPLGSGNPSIPFAGSQVGLTYANPIVATGTIVFDNVGAPIRQSGGTWLTTEDQFFTEGSPINIVKLERNVVIVQARANISSYQVVKWTGLDLVQPALYNDTQQTLIAICPQTLLTGETGNAVVQGLVTNPAWNWAAADVGKPLWISATNPGMLTLTDANTVDPVLYPPQPPVARIRSQTSVMFDQGLGGLIQVVPPAQYIYNAANLDPSGARVFAQKNGNVFEFRTLKSNTLTVTQNTNNITLETARVGYNSGANLGTGTAVYAGMTGSVLNFKTLVAGANVTISSDRNTITISSTGGGGGGGGGGTLTICGADIECPVGPIPPGALISYDDQDDKWKIKPPFQSEDIHLQMIGLVANSFLTSTPGQPLAAFVANRPISIPDGAGWCSGQGVPQFYSVNAATTGTNGVWVVSGNVTNVFTPGTTFVVQRNTTPFDVFGAYVTVNSTFISGNTNIQVNFVPVTANPSISQIVVQGMFAAQAFALSPSRSTVDLGIFVKHTNAISEQQIGTIRFTRGASVGAFSFTDKFGLPTYSDPNRLMPGDVIVIRRTTPTADPTLGNIALTIPGTIINAPPTNGCLF